MTRLTKETKEKIKVDLVHHRFNANVGSLMDDRAHLAELVYKDFYKPVDRDRMEALPKGWLNEASQIQARFGTSYMAIPFNGDGFNGPMARYKPDRKVVLKRVLVAQSDRGPCWKTYDATHPLSIEFDALDGRLRDLLANIDRAERAVAAALASVTTIDKLIEQWPEMAPFAKKYDVEPRQLPMIQKTELNEMLGLPV